MGLQDRANATLRERSQARTLENTITGTSVAEGRVSGRTRQGSAFVVGGRRSDAWVRRFYEPTNTSALVGEGLEQGGRVESAARESARVAGQQAAADFAAAEKAATKQSIETTRDLNAEITAQFNDHMSAIDPGWQDRMKELGTLATDAAKVSTEFMDKYAPGLLEQGYEMSQVSTGIIKDLMAGKVPGDVARQVSSRAAETANAFGIMGDSAGGAGRALEARDLGMTSLSLMLKGVLMAPNANAPLNSAYQTVMGIAQAPYALQQAQHAEANGYMPGLLNPMAAYNANLQGLSNSSVLPASAVYSASLNSINALLNASAAVESANQQQRLSLAGGALNRFDDFAGMGVNLASSIIGAEATKSAAGDAADAAMVSSVVSSI